MCRWEPHKITSKVVLTQPLGTERQFAATTGSAHHMLLDDAAGGTGPKPIELVAVGLAGCTAFDVITVLRQKYHQRVTGYEVLVEADQAERPPQVFTARPSSLWEKHLTAPKTADSVATVPVCDALAEILEPIRQESGYILAGPSGKPLDLHNAAARICAPTLSCCVTCRKQRHEANGHVYSPVMEWRGWYACRRGLATAAASLDSAMAAKSLLRHKNMGTTLAHYVKSEDSAGLRASGKISALFENSNRTAVQ